VDKLKLDSRTRLKYGLIRMKNIVGRLPIEIRQLTPIAKLVLSVSQDLWDLNKTEKVDLKDVLMIEETCETLERILNELEGGPPDESSQD
jgi:hypothetical protein